MSRKLRISPTLSLPRDTVTQTNVVYGGKGMGKTNFGAVLCEEFSAAGLHFSVIDPMGVWWGLRHSKDGKGPGIPVLILGGKHGDIPIEPTGGAVVADLVADEEADVIVDISRRPDGTMWSLGERIRFVTDYCTRLYMRQGERARPLMQLIDEAGRFVPQMIPHGSPQLAACVGAIERMVEEGRNVGIGVTLITQRSARMNKSVSELAECMIAFRTVGPRSVDAILDWLGEHIPKSRWKELVEQLRALPRGTALVVSPGWLEFEGVVAMRARETFDSSATPKAGQERRASGPGAKPDLRRYQERMAETIERAKAEDPKALLKRIRELEAAKGAASPEIKKRLSEAEAKVRQLEKELLAALKAAERDQKSIDALVQRHLASTVRDIKRQNTELARALKGAVAELSKRLGAVQREIGSADQALKVIAALKVDEDPQLPPLALGSLPAPARVPDPAPRHAAPRPLPRDVYSGVTDPRDDVAANPRSRDGKKGGGIRQKLLDSLAAFEAMGLTEVRRPNAAFFAGISHEGGYFTNNLGAMRSEGLIDYPSDGTVALTDAGRAIANAPDRPPTLEALHHAWIWKLKGIQGRMLRSLIDIYPASCTRQELGEMIETSIAGGYFTNNLGRLRSLGVADYPTSGTVVATDLLFPEGLR